MNFQLIINNEICSCFVGFMSWTRLRLYTFQVYADASDVRNRDVRPCRRTDSLRNSVKFSVANSRQLTAKRREGRKINCVDELFARENIRDYYNTNAVSESESDREHFPFLTPLTQKQPSIFEGAAMFNGLTYF